MSIYKNTVFFHICSNCGSLDWGECIDSITIYYTTNKDGVEIKTDEDYGDVVELKCGECDQYNSIHELAVDKSYWKRIHDMKDENRLIYIIKLMTQKKIRFNKSFVDDVILYHKDDIGFMSKISEHLEKLGYTKITRVR